MWKIFVVTFLAVGAMAHDLDSVLKSVREQCAKNNPGGTVPDFVAISNNFKTCMTNIINVTTLKNEIELAKPNGALDEVFKKYCDKSPEIKQCSNTVLDSIKPCIPDQYSGNVNSFRSVTEQLLDFVCYKDGDRIALFIAEGGPECFQQKAESVKSCLLAMKENFPSVEAATNMPLTERCQKVNELTTCIVKALEECSTPTPANMVESLIKFIRKDTPCPVASA